MIADATGAREVLKKARRRGMFDEDFGGEMNIFEILQMFRDHRGLAGEREPLMRVGVDQIQQMLMDAAHAEEFSDGDGLDDVHDEQHFGMNFAGAHAQAEEAKGERHSSDEDIPRFGQNRPDNQVIRGSGNMNRHDQRISMANPRPNPRPQEPGDLGRNYLVMPNSNGNNRPSGSG
jgi:hypothetical protein